VSAYKQREDGSWIEAEPLPEPFGVVWGRLWQVRQDRGERKWFALIRSWFDTRAVTKLARGVPNQETRGDS
jgi:hypothetical protein